MIQQLGAGRCVQVLQMFHWDLRLHVHDAQDERRVLNLEDRTQWRIKADDIIYILSFLDLLIQYKQLGTVVLANTFPTGVNSAFVNCLTFFNHGFITNRCVYFWKQDSACGIDLKNIRCPCSCSHPVQ